MKLRHRLGREIYLKDHLSDKAAKSTLIRFFDLRRIK